MISEEVRSMVVALYKEERFKIKEIMVITGVRSKQTIYRILNEANVTKIKRKNPAAKISVTLDNDVSRILAIENPKNISKWICKMTKKGYLHCRKDGR